MTQARLSEKRIWCVWVRGSSACASETGYQKECGLYSLEDEKLYSNLYAGMGGGSGSGSSPGGSERGAGASGADDGGSLSVSGAEEDELPKSVIVTNVGLGVFDCQEGKVS